jgi:hypothetical protein
MASAKVAPIAATTTSAWALIDQQRDDDIVA